METEQSNMRKSAKNSNALTKELTMVQSDKTVKDTLAIDHKGKIRQAPKKEDTPTSPNSSEMKPPNGTREKEGRDDIEAI